jgi:hypothetical protein
MLETVETGKGAWIRQSRANGQAQLSWPAVVGSTVSSVWDPHAYTALRLSTDVPSGIVSFRFVSMCGRVKALAVP